MYDGALNAFMTLNGNSESFDVKVRLHQGSVLSLFTIVMNIIHIIPSTQENIIHIIPLNTREHYSHYSS